MTYKNWMEQNSNIHNKLLRNICLPMTHDSGTYGLTNELSPQYSEALVMLENIIAALAEALIKAGVPEKYDPLEQLLKEAIPAVKGLTTATERSITQQLNDGIRGFDFRVMQKRDGFFIFHGLKGPNIEDILKDIVSFLETTLGEILYINFSHYISSGDDFDYTAFGNLVDQYLVGWAFPVNYDKSGTITNDPFNMKYQDIVTDATVGTSSRVILVSGDPLGDSDIFWPVEYCPPVEDRHKDVLVGRYTDTENLDKMISDQKQFFDTALSQDLPFVLYMTLTPSIWSYILIIVSSLHGAVQALADDLDLIPGLEEVAAAVEVIAVALEALEVETEIFGFRTLQELSERVDRKLTSLVKRNFISLSSGENQVSMIFSDFYETTTLVELAIGLSNDIVLNWSGNSPIAIGADKPTTEDDPSIVAYQGKLYLFYIADDDSNQIWQAVYDPVDGWISNDRIASISNINPKSNKGPTAAVYGDDLYLVYKGNGDSTSIRQAVLSEGQWSGDKKIREISDITARSNKSPWLTPFEGELALVYKSESNNDLYWSRFNGKWYAEKRIEVGGKKVKSNKRPSATEFDGKLYLLHKGEFEHIYQSIFDPQSGNWSGNKKIKDLPDTDINPKTDDGPGVAVYAGDIYLFYAGEATEHVYQSVFNGSIWGQNERLENISDIDPKTKDSPYPARLGTDLFLVNRGKDDYIYLSVLSPVHF